MDLLMISSIVLCKSLLSHVTHNISLIFFFLFGNHWHITLSFCLTIAFDMYIILILIPTEIYNKALSHVDM